MNAHLPSLSQGLLPSLSCQKATGRALQGVKVLMGVVRFGRVEDAALMNLLDKLGKAVPDTSAPSLGKPFVGELGIA